MLKVKKYWYHLLYADIISFFATGKCQKIRIINKNSYCWRRKSSYLLNNLRKLLNFRKDSAHDNIKTHKKVEFHPLYRKHIFGKTTGGPNWPLAFLGSRRALCSNWKKIQGQIIVFNKKAVVKICNSNSPP